MRSQDLQSNVQIEIYKINWSWNKNTEKWLRHMCKNKTILNIPCGLSQLGNVRADIDKNMNPDVICDVHHLPFRDQCFDVIVCDPPFSLYNHFKWVNRLARVSRELLLCSPIHVPWLKGMRKKIYATIQRGNFFVRLWIQYTPKNQELNHET